MALTIIGAKLRLNKLFKKQFLINKFLKVASTSTILNNGFLRRECCKESPRNSEEILQYGLKFSHSALLQKLEKPSAYEFSRKYFSSEGNSRGSPGRDKFHADTESALNTQICVELNAAFAYLSMSTYFGRTSVALPGCQAFFMNMHKEEMEHANYFIDYQLLRGGEVKWSPINPPDGNEWEEGICKVFSVSIDMEKTVKKKLQELNKVAEKHCDLEVMDITTKFMADQHKSICEMGRYFVRASKMIEDPIGEYLFDKALFKENNKKAAYK